MAPPHHPHGWIVDDRKKRPLEEIGELLVRMGNYLKTDGGILLGKVQVKPPDPCLLIFGYERLPKGEMALKIELQWDHREGFEHGEDGDLQVLPLSTERS